MQEKKTSDIYGPTKNTTGTHNTAVGQIVRVISGGKIPLVHTILL
jgi:hypothetical protein